MPFKVVCRVYCSIWRFGGIAVSGSLMLLVKKVQTEGEHSSHLQGRQHIGGFAKAVLEYMRGTHRTCSADTGLLNNLYNFCRRYTDAAW